MLSSRTLRVCVFLGYPYSKLTLDSFTGRCITGAHESGGRTSRRKVLDCPRVLKSCINAYVLSSLEYCALAWMSSVESHLGLLYSVVRIAEGLCEGELCCLGYRRKVSALCFLYKIYHRVDHPMNEYLNPFIATLNTRVSAALSKLILVIQRCRTDQFSRSFLPSAVRLWNLLLSGVFSGDTLSSFKSTENLCLLKV